MKRETDETTRHDCRADLKSLVAPLAAYVAATDDPRVAVAEVVSELIGEAVAIEVSARRHLDRDRTRRGDAERPRARRRTASSRA